MHVICCLKLFVTIRSSGDEKLVKGRKEGSERGRLQYGSSYVKLCLLKKNCILWINKQFVNGSMVYSILERRKFLD